MLGLEFERAVSHNIVIHSNVAAANQTRSNSAAYAELLSDKLIKSHEIILALKVPGAGRGARKRSS